MSNMYYVDLCEELGLIEHKYRKEVEYDLCEMFYNYKMGKASYYGISYKDKKHLTVDSVRLSHEEMVYIIKQIKREVTKYRALPLIKKSDLMNTTVSERYIVKFSAYFNEYAKKAVHSIAKEWEQYEQQQEDMDSVIEKYENRMIEKYEQRALENYYKK